MSAYIQVPPPTGTALALVELLALLSQHGFGPESVEIHSEPMPLFGYKGDQRPECAHVIIRRKHVGYGANDVGFVRTADGFTAIISEYDTRATVPALYAALLSPVAVPVDVQTLRCSVLKTQARKLGYAVTEQRDGDQIKLTILRRT